MTGAEAFDEYDPGAAGEEDEWGNDLEGLRYNLSLSPQERWDQYVSFANGVVGLVEAGRSSGFAEAGRGLGL